MKNEKECKNSITTDGNKYGNLEKNKAIVISMKGISPVRRSSFQRFAKYKSARY